MKLKIIIVIFAAYFIGNIYGLTLEEQFNEVTDVENCQVLCSKDIDLKNTNSKKTQCVCPHRIDTVPIMGKNNPKLVSLNHNLDTNIEHEEKKGIKVKRQIIQELINNKNKIKGKPIKSTTLFSNDNPSTKFKIGKEIKKSEKKSRSSGLRTDNKQIPSIQEVRERLKDLRERMSVKPRFQSRGSFPEVDKPKAIIKKFNDKRNEIIDDLKTLRSRSAIGKGSTPLKEMVGSINHLQNHIDNIASSIKEKIKERTEDRKIKDKSKIVENEYESKEKVGAIKKLSSTPETPKLTTSAIPEIVLGKTESFSSKTEDVIQKIPESKLMGSDKLEADTKKAEAVSVTLEKIKEKQKEAVIKMKDKLNVARQSKHLEKN